MYQMDLSLLFQVLEIFTFYILLIFVMRQNLFQGFFLIITGWLKEFVKIGLWPLFTKNDSFFVNKLFKALNFLVFLSTILNASFINKPFDLVANDHFKIILLFDGTVSWWEIKESLFWDPWMVFYCIIGIIHFQNYFC